MSYLEYLLFNLLFNSSFSFIAGLTIVFLTIKLFRVNDSRWKLFLFILPFVKIVWDVFQGIPDSSFIYHGIDPFSLPENSRTFSLGAALSEWGPKIFAFFTIRDFFGFQYSISIADFAAAWLARNFTVDAPRAILFGLVGTSIALLFYRVFGFLRFEWKRVKDRKSLNSRKIKDLVIGMRTVDVYATTGFTGSPFTGGFFKPFICLPESAVEDLSEAELNAVIEHEVAHIRGFDLPVSIFVMGMGDLFWFVPGYRFLSRKIDRLRELLADRQAVSSGAGPAHLASALLKLKDAEIKETHVLYSAFMKERSLLKRRVLTLIGDEKETRHLQPRFGWNNRFVRAAVVLWTTGGVMISTLGGNHEVQQVPAWIETLMKGMGFM